MPNRARGARRCAQWLTECLRIGWTRQDLDRLERLWWRYHDENGHLIQCVEGNVTDEEEAAVGRPGSQDGQGHRL